MDIERGGLAISFDPRNINQTDPIFLDFPVCKSAPLNIGEEIMDKSNDSLDAGISNLYTESSQEFETVIFPWVLHGHTVEKKNDKIAVDIIGK